MPSLQSGGRARGRAADSRGFTLLEVVLAFSILAVVMVVMIGSLRVGTRAWETGERRTAVRQELRAIVELLTEAMGSAYPYRGRLGQAPERVVLFQGDEGELRFVTTAAPLVLDAPVAPFHAVTLRRSDDDRLLLVERMVPAEEPFGDTPETVLSRSVSGLKLQYLDDKGNWLDQWDGKEAGGLPLAVRLELSIRDRGRIETVPPLVVPIPLGKSAA
jgi:general secretion pathway protein J